MIAALFVERDGVYYGLTDVDPWDAERDARNYAGPHPVVAHPPCSRWCRLAGLVEARWGHKRGDDGGCFRHALQCVRDFGGVLEHPAYSDAWPAFSLPTPSPSGWQRDMDGAWVAHVEQGRYGHAAKKATWLYAVCREPPPCDGAGYRTSNRARLCHGAAIACAAARAARGSARQRRRVRRWSSVTCSSASRGARR